MGVDEEPAVADVDWFLWGIDDDFVVCCMWLIIIMVVVMVVIVVVSGFGL